MRLVTFEHNGRPAPGVLEGERIIPLTAIAPDLQTIIADQISLAHISALVESAADAVPLTAVKLLAPLPTPRRNIMCLGLNYAEHAKESATAMGHTANLPEVPVVFNKATTAVTGPYDPIPYDAQVTTMLDWEVELAVIIGKQGKNIKEAAAMSHVFGYTILNDISARDLQRKGKQFFKGKSLDGACPMGPWLVTADSLPDPHNLKISCAVNGIVKQDSLTKYMIFDIPATIAYLSKGMTLLPGDIIATGTPDGVGFARTPAEFLQPGDLLESQIEGIGSMRNPIGG